MLIRKGNMMKNKWHFLNPRHFNPRIFGLEEIFAVKVKKHDDNRDVRTISLPGWNIIAEQVEYNPVTGQKFQDVEWYIFAAIGEEIGL